jgi:hypothetical protein
VPIGHENILLDSIMFYSIPIAYLALELGHVLVPALVQAADAHPGTWPLLHRREKHKSYSCSILYFLTKMYMLEYMQYMLQLDRFIVPIEGEFSVMIYHVETKPNVASSKLWQDFRSTSNLGGEQ